MASATNDLELLIYQLIFNSGFGDSYLDTNTLTLELTNGDLVGDDGTAGLQLIGGTAVAGSVLAPGYTPQPLVDGGDVFELGMTGDTGTWSNQAILDFGTNSSGVNWPSISGWAIAQGFREYLLYGSFASATGATQNYVVNPGKSFTIPINAFRITID
jgi:hypothetical protein